MEGLVGILVETLSRAHVIVAGIAVTGLELGRVVLDSLSNAPNAPSLPYSGVGSPSAAASPGPPGGSPDTAADAAPGTPPGAQPSPHPDDPEPDPCR